MNSIKIALVCLAIIAAVSAQARSPGQMLVDHINSLILSVRNEQTEHDDIYQIQKRECDDETGFRKREVADAVDALTRATEHRGRCQAAAASANADLIRARTYQQIMTEQVESITNRRTSEAASLATKLGHFNNALNLIDQAEQIVQEFANAQTSFVQVTKHFNTMFLEGTKGGLSQDLAPLLAVLVEVGEKQVGGQVSSDNIARIRQLLAALREKLTDSIALLTANENQYIEDFLARRERVNQVIVLLGNTQNRLSAYLAQMQACMTKEDDIINSATSKRIRNQNLLNYATDMCSAFDTEYTDATSARRREVELLGKLRTFVEQRAEDFSTYGGENQDVLLQYAKTGETAAQEVQFLQLRANLRQRKQ